jgi:voltage-gated potassium channel
MAPLASFKHLILLVVLIASLVLQPAIPDWAVVPFVYEFISYMMVLVVFIIVFERPRERWLALVVGSMALTANLIGHSAAGSTKLAATVAFHTLVATFLYFAIYVILRAIFRNQRIRLDHLCGALSGYMLSGLAWANLYLVVYLLSDDAFRISTDLVPQLANEMTRRHLFNYFSFITLTTVGFGDIAPVAPIACSLVWLEATFGQFFVAVIVGQLIGVKLAQTTNSPPTRVHADHESPPTTH